MFLLLALLIFIALYGFHLRNYLLQNEIIIQNFDVLGKKKDKFKMIKFEKSFLARELIIVRNYNTTDLKLSWIQKHIGDNNDLVIDTLSDNKYYKIPLKKWYEVFEKNKHKEMIVFDDSKTLRYFDYDKQIMKNIRVVYPSRLYFVASPYLTYHQVGITQFYRKVESFYRVVVSLEEECEIVVVHPENEDSLYTTRIESQSNSPSMVLSSYPANHKINYTKYPKARNLKYVKIKCPPKSAVFIPRSWFYAVVNYKGCLIEKDIHSYVSWTYEMVKSGLRLK